MRHISLILVFLIISAVFLVQEIQAQLPDSLDMLEDMALIANDSVEFEGERSPEGLTVLKIKGKWGFKDNNLNTVIPFIYDEAGDFEEGLAEVRKDDYWGYINTKGEVVLPFIYENAYRFSGGLAAVRVNKKWGFIHKNGDFAIPAVYDDVYSFSEDRAMVMNNEKWGFIDKTGKSLTLLEYDFAQDFSLGFAVAEKETQKGVINREGKTVIPFQYDKIVMSDSLLFLVKQKGKWGMMSCEGQEITPCIYEEIYGMYESPGFSSSTEVPSEMEMLNNKPILFPYFMVRLAEKQGLITRHGKIIISPIYDYINYNPPFWEIMMGQNIGFADSTGHVLVSPKYTATGFFENGMMTVSVDSVWGVINKGGKGIIAPQYQEIKGYYGELFAVRSGELWGYIDKDNKIIIPFLFSEAESFEKEYAVVQKAGYYGVINKQGKTCIEFKYRKIQILPDGKHAIGQNQNQKEVIINIATHKIISKEYNTIIPDEKGKYFVVSLNEKMGIADSKGRLILPIKYSQIVHSNLLDLFWVQQEGKYGLMDKNKKWKINPMYESIEPFYEGKAWIDDGSDYYWINSQGERQKEPTFRSDFP